jgi:UDP-glucose 4-epimerase
MRVLVTGGAGYIGSIVVEELLAMGAERVVVLDDLSTGHARAVSAPAQLVRGGIADRDLVRSLCREAGIGAVIHMAASSLVAESMRAPERYHQNNVTASLALCDALLSSGVRRLVFSSSAAVYGEPHSDVIEETHPTAPVNPYGATKLAFEQALAELDRKHGLHFAALRYFNAAGATAQNGEQHDPETHLIPLVLAVAQGRRPHIGIYGTDYPTPDGTCIRDYIHVSDLARAHVLALGAIESESRTYNLGAERGTSVLEVVRTAEAVTGRPIPLVHSPRREGDPARLVASSARIRADLGWQPARSSLERIIGDAWAWLQAHPRGYVE